MFLSDRISDKLLNPKQKKVLQKAGLGLKNIAFDLEETEEKIYNKLTSLELDEVQNTIGFPHLKNCDGFELLWCVTNCRILESIECAMLLRHLKHLLAKEKFI